MRALNPDNVYSVGYIISRFMSTDIDIIKRRQFSEYFTMAR